MLILFFFIIIITIIVFGICLFYAHQLYDDLRRGHPAAPTTRDQIIAILSFMTALLVALITLLVTIYLYWLDNPTPPPPPEHDCSAKAIRFKVTWEDTGDSLAVDNNRVDLTRNAILMIDAHDGMNGGDNSQSALHCEWEVLEDGEKIEANGCTLKFKPGSDEHVDTIQVTASYPNCVGTRPQTIFIHPPDDK